MDLFYEFKKFTYTPKIKKCKTIKIGTKIEEDPGGEKYFWKIPYHGFSELLVFGQNFTARTTHPFILPKVPKVLLVYLGNL